MTLEDFFPPSERVLYRRPQLRQVICQLRFPPILRIEGQPPADFQDQIRELFPLLEPATDTIAPQLPKEIAQLLGRAVSTGRYQFRTEDKHNSLSLAPDSISLTSTAYTRWEIFRELLRVPLAALLSVYKPSFYQRIGLRYINAIRREDLGLSDQPWSVLLSPAILGKLALPHWERHLLEAKRLIA